MPHNATDTGSLTTPPCSESVKWHVTVSHQGVSKSEVISYRFALELVENYRGVQPLNGREVTEFPLVVPSDSSLPV